MSTHQSAPIPPTLIRSLLATPSLRQFGQPQYSIITRYRLKRDITMPTLLCTLLLIEVQESILVQFLGLLGTDDADLVVFAAEPLLDTG